MLGFIIAIVAGFLVPQLESALADPIIKVMKGHIVIAENEKRLIAFMAAMLIAAIIGALLGSGTSFGVMFGGVLGYFGTRLFAAAKVAMDKTSGPTQG